MLKRKESHKMKKLKYIAIAGLMASTILLSDVPKVQAAQATQIPPIFDATYYSQKNPDVAIIAGNDKNVLYQHFINFGLKEGRAFSMLFDVEAYKKANKDLASVFGNNNFAYYLHFVNFGLKENRNGGGEFNSSLYLKANPDLAATIGNNPLALYQQFVEKGREEGRKISTPAKNNNKDKETQKKPAKPSKTSNSSDNKPKPEEKPSVEEPMITVLSIDADKEDKQLMDTINQLIGEWENFKYEDTRTLGEDFAIYTEECLAGETPPESNRCFWWDDPEVVKPTLQSKGKLQGTVIFSINQKSIKIKVKVILPKLEKSESWKKEQTLKEVSQAMKKAVDSLAEKTISSYDESGIMAAMNKAVTDESVQIIDVLIRPYPDCIRISYIISKDKDPNSPYIFDYYRIMKPIDLTEQEQQLYNTIKSEMEAYATQFTCDSTDRDTVGNLFQTWITDELNRKNVQFDNSNWAVRGYPGYDGVVSVRGEFRLKFSDDNTKNPTIYLQKSIPPFHGLDGEIEPLKSLPLFLQEEETSESALPFSEVEEETIQPTESQTEEESSEETIVTEEQSEEEAASEEESIEESTEQELSTEDLTLKTTK